MPTNDELTGSNMSLIRQEGRLLRRIVAVAVLAIVMFIAGGDAVLADNHQFLLCSGPGETKRSDGTTALSGDYVIVVNSRNFNAITNADDQVPEDTITEEDVKSSGGSFVRPDLSWGMWIPSGYVYEEQGTGTCVINLKLMMREKGSNYFKEAAVEFDPLPPCQGRLWLNTARPTGVAADVCPRGAPTTSGVTPTDDEADTNAGDTNQSDDLPGGTEDPVETVTDPGEGKPGDTGTPTPPGGNTGGGNTGGGNTGGGNTGGGNTGGGDTSGADTGGGDTSGGDTSGGDTGGGDTSGGDTSGGDTSGGDTSGGDTSGGDTSGGDTSGGDTSGGDTSGGDTSGGDTSGGDTSGGDTSGGDTSGGDTGGADTSGGDTGGGNGDSTGGGNDGNTDGGSAGDTGSGDGDGSGSGSQTSTDSSRPDDDSTDQSNADLLETEGDGSGSDDMMQTESELEGDSDVGDKQDSDKDEDQPRATVRPDVPRTGTGGVAAQRDSDRLAIPIGVAAGLAVVMALVVMVVNRRFGNRAL